MRGRGVDRPRWESHSGICCWVVSAQCPQLGRDRSGGPSLAREQNGLPNFPGSLGTPAVLVLELRRLWAGAGLAPSAFLAGRPLLLPAGQAPPTPYRTLDTGGRWRPDRAHGRNSVPLSPAPSSLGCTPASLPLRAGHSGHRLDSVGLRRTALLPPRRRGPDQRDAAPLPLRALAAAAAGDWPRAAQCPAQCPGQCPLPPAHMEDLGYAPLEAWVRGLKQSGAGLGFRRGSRQTLTGLRSRVCGA